MLEAELPDLLLLGILDRFNSCDTCEECHKTWEQLPIVLLSRHNVVDEYFQHFRKLATSRGATDVISNDLLKLDRLLLALPQPSAMGASPHLGTEQIATNTSGANILAAFAEITAIGNNYFGPLAQGNYLRKSHSQLVAKFPALQQWSADHFGIVSCNDTALQTEYTTADFDGLRHWVAAYISECERIIVDFGEILGNSQLSDLTRQLL